MHSESRRDISEIIGDIDLNYIMQEQDVTKNRFIIKLELSGAISKKTVQTPKPKWLLKSRGKCSYEI